MVAVRNLYTSLLVLLTQATDRELGRMVRYLKEKNRIFRARLPERINVIRKERNRLLRRGRAALQPPGRVVAGVLSHRAAAPGQGERGTPTWA